MHRGMRRRPASVRISVTMTSAAPRHCAARAAVQCPLPQPVISGLVAWNRPTNSFRGWRKYSIGRRRVEIGVRVRARFALPGGPASLAASCSTGGESCGRNEYALPQCGHQPSDNARPSGVDRPTGRPQFQQNRFDSATTGLVISASSGSFSGTRGNSTRPPPSRCIRDSARVSVVRCSSGSVTAVPAEVLSESSSKCGRNIACVAIGRIVDMESMPRSSKLAGCVPIVGSADGVPSAPSS